MSIRLCNHLKDDGAYCRSFAVRNRDFCYFHLEVVARRKRIERALARQRLKPICQLFARECMALALHHQLSYLDC
jgi:hypothetical protein